MTRRVPPRPVSVLTILTLESVAHWKEPPFLPRPNPLYAMQRLGGCGAALVVARRGNVMSHT